jgi:hypothetical protein
MNYASLALGLAMLALGLVFRANATKSDDPLAARNSRFASTMMLLAAAAFFAAAAISYFSSNSQGA